MQPDIDERVGGVFAPDALLPTQYFDRVRRRKDLTGEQRLMCAVIDDLRQRERICYAPRNPA